MERQARKTTAAGQASNKISGNNRFTQYAGIVSYSGGWVLSGVYGGRRCDISKPGQLCGFT